MCFQLKTCEKYIKIFDRDHWCTTSVGPLINLKHNELDIAANEDVPIFNEKFFILLGVETFLQFKALFRGFAMECAKPEQIIIDEKFIKRINGAVIKKRTLQVTVPEIFDVSIKGLTGV